MDTKSILQGLEEFRKYLSGEAPMLVGGVNDDISDLVPTYFTGTPDPNAEIWKLFEYVKANPDRFADDLEKLHQELLLAHCARDGNQ
jgi:hypothetical protein